MVTEANAINAATTGIVGNTGTSFTGTAVTQYNVIVGGSTSSTVANVAPSATSGVPLISQGAAANPAFGTAVVAGGGTGAVTLTGVLIGNGTSAVTGNAVTQYDVLVGGASNAISSVGPGSSGQVLQSGGNAANPAYSTATYPATATGTGTILRADGTNWSATTTTYPNTNAINTLLYASSANVMSALATANNGILITSATGVPSILADGTTGQVLTATTGSPPSWANPATSGTVTTVSVVTANGFAGTVANASSTPAITLTTSQTGLISGNGTALTGTAITQYNVITGGASNAPNSVAPSATSGVPLISQGSSSQPVFGTAVVAGGGTGNTTQDAYSIVCGGTSTTGAFQAVDSVAAGQVLTSAGTSSLPAWSATPSVTSISFDSGSHSLSSYVNSTFTPGIAFGGGTTGITYTTQLGQYVRIGNIVYIQGRITLSSKGSSTGGATVTGLPVTVSQSVTGSIPIFMRAAITLTTNFTRAVINPANGGTTGQIQQEGSAQNSSSLSDTNFANTSDFSFAGIYTV